MRGDNCQDDGLFSYISLEQRVPQGHPLRRLRVLVDPVLQALSARFYPDVRSGGPPLDRPGETAAGAAAARPVQYPQRTALDGAAGLQPAVSLVCGSEPG